MAVELTPYRVRVNAIAPWVHGYSPTVTGEAEATKVDGRQIEFTV
jgi:hypothetical protein